MPQPSIGPTLISTLFSRDAAASIKAWCDYLHQEVHSETTISSDQARHWGYTELAGNKETWLMNALGEPWLRIIEAPNASQLQPFTHYGWLSLEISVKNVDALYPQLKGSPFKIIGEPANLDVSDDIRAMQVQGPDGEILYLTEVKAPVPPFELPFARCAVDRLFIPVAMVPDRKAALAVYEQFENVKGLQFDTKITVINRALGLDINTRHPVATIQLAGKNLIELDQVEGLVSASTNKLYTGIGMISFAVQNIPKMLGSYTIDHGAFTNSKAALRHDASGSTLEFINLSS